jgi:hypothetical protein
MELFMKALRIVAVILIPLLLSLLGGVLGAYLGGNYWVNFSLFGVRGYEATGLLGVLLGFLGGVLLSRRLFFLPAGK